MQCPKCNSELESVMFKEIEIERCSGCKGLWFQPDELATLRNDSWMADYILDEGKAKVGKEFDRIRDVDCPICGVKMEQQADADQSHIIYEVCPAGHGIFLDAGEFTDLVHKTFWDRFKKAR